MKRYIYKKGHINFIVSVFDWVGALLFAKLRFNKTARESAPNRILVFKPDHIGDVLLATPFLCALKKKYPSASVTVVIGGWAYEILAGNPNIDEIVTFNVPWLTREISIRHSWFNLIKLIIRFRRGNFDLFYCLRSDLIGNLIGFLSNIPIRVGFFNGGGGFLLTDSYNEFEDKHQTSVLLQVLQKGKWESESSIKPMVYLFNKEKQDAENILDAYKLNGRPLAGFSLGAGYPSKIWAAEKFAILIKKTYTEMGYRPLILGGKEDVSLIERIKNVLNECDAINLVGKIDLRLSFALIRKCRFFVGNDSAPAHIAAALGVPVIVIFSAANSPHRWRPVGERIQCIYRDISCKLCEKSVCVDNKCLNGITSGEVFNAIRAYDFKQR